MPENLVSKIRTLALEAGFDLFGVTSAEPFEQERARLASWLAQGFAGDMNYLRNNTEKRIEPRLILPSVKSIICLGISYFYDEPSLRAEGKAIRSVTSPDCFVANAPRNDRQGKVARYAWGKDYHKVLKKKLKALKSQITQLAGPATELKDYTDTGPLLERQAAARAGLGFIGKNTLLLHPKMGSYFFLSEILTNLELEPGTPITTSCGSCRACIDACPTQAFPQPYQLDATRCISYWTIEHRGEIPEKFHAGIGDHAFGCDICQEVCPFNRRPLPSQCEEFAPAHGPGTTLHLDQISRMDEETFRQTFQHTSLTRTKYPGIIRNTKIVQRNLCSPAS